MPQLTPSQLDHYREHSFVLVEDLLDPTTDIDPVLAEYDEVLDNLANELFARRSDRLHLRRPRL